MTATAGQRAEGRTDDQKERESATTAVDKPSATEAELRSEIGRLRIELAGTVEELSERLDVRKHAKRRVAEGTERLREQAPLIGAVVGIGVAAVVVAIISRAVSRSKEDS